MIRRTVPPGVLCLVVCCALALGLQWINRADDSQFGGAGDESAHFVTGLMLHDYLAAGVPERPLPYGEKYYLHYPQVAFGHWPPLYYCLEAAWMLLFGATRVSVLVLSALLTGVLAGTTAWVGWNRLGPWQGLMAGLCLVLLPPIQHHTSMVMLDVPVTLAVTWAVISLTRLLETNSLKWALAFALTSSLAILTKANALCLPLVVITALLLLRQPKRLWSRPFLLAGVLTGVLTAPFYVWSWRLLRTGTEKHSYGVHEVLGRILEQSPQLLLAFGIVTSVLALVGLGTRVVRPFFRSQVEPFWAVLASVFAGGFLFHVLVPTSADPRKVFLTVPPALLLAAAAVSDLSALLPWWPGRPAWRLAFTGGLALAAFGAVDFRLVEARHGAMNYTAQRIADTPALNNTAILVGSSRYGENGAVAAIAERETRPGRYVIRAAKFMGTGSWHGLNYRFFYQSDEELLQAIRAVPCRLVILHWAPEKQSYAHFDTLVRAVHGNPAAFRARPDLVDSGRLAPGERLEVWEPIGIDAGELHVKVDLSDRIGRALSEDRSRDSGN